MESCLEQMEDEERGILIMIDGDHFKHINDRYGHSMGDEVIKLTAQMIIGRIRTVDLASRLHGDEFAIFVSNTADYTVARGIIGDINHSIAKEAKRRNMPSITISAGAVVAKRGDSYAGAGQSCGYWRCTAPRKPITEALRITAEKQRSEVKILLPAR